MLFRQDLPLYREVKIAVSKCGARQRRRRSVGDGQQLVVEPHFHVLDQPIAGFKIGRVLPQVGVGGMLQQVIFIVELKVPVAARSDLSIVGNKWGLRRQRTRARTQYQDQHAA